MYNFTVLMALVDYIPVGLFLVSAILMMKNFYYRLPKYGFALLAAGSINVFIAGFLKATWKLLYAANICDFTAFNTLFMPTQSLGFMMLGVALMILVSDKKNKVLSVAGPAVFTGTAFFLVIMVLGLGCVCVCLAIYAARLKKKGTIVLFVLSFVFSMMMGYMGTMDSTLAWINWVEQFINIASQGCLLLGVLTINKYNKIEAYND